jgi:hypothetical protein
VISDKERDFHVRPVFVGSRSSRRKMESGPWAIVALSSDPLTPHRYLAGNFQSAEEACDAFKSGFDVIDPAKAPTLTASRIVARMLENPQVVPA